MPGTDGTGQLFAPLLAALGPETQTQIVRYPDVPGAYPEHEAVARTSLPQTQPFVLLGESFSGPIVVSIAAKPPPNLIGIVICASFVKCPRPMLAAFQTALSVVNPLRVPRFILETLTLGRFATPELRLALRDVLAELSPQTLTARLRAIARVDVTERARSVQLPALYLRATKDRLVPASAGDAFRHLVPRARICDIEGPHFLLQAAPRASAAALKEFMSGL